MEKKLTLAYLRISTEHQTVENQEYALLQYCQKQNLRIDQYIKVVISSRKKDTDRKIDEMLDSLSSGDTLIVTELSRLGRSVANVLNIINLLILKKINLHMIKENLIIEPNNPNPMALFMINIFASFGQLERDIISLRTKEALAARKAKGIQLGKPKGTVQSSIYDKDQEQIFSLFDMGVPLQKIIEVHLKYGKYNSLRNYLKKHKVL
jgi:DNA invertase Pin-like site-specific DNA recombinase